MPWTFAHPAAVLPLRRYCPRWLSFPALMVGTLMPDLSYYLADNEFLYYAHTLPGCVALCMPLGLLLLALLYRWRLPLIHLLPQPHRDALATVAAPPVAITPALLLSLALSLILGAVTHLAWDACTHLRGGLVEHLPWLKARLILWQGTTVPVYNVLQHASTLLGVGLLARAYRDWLRHSAASRTVSPEDEQWRRQLIGGIALLALAGAGYAASRIGLYPGTHFALTPFARELAVQGTVLFMLLYALCAATCHRATAQAAGPPAAR